MKYRKSLQLFTAGLFITLMISCGPGLECTDVTSGEEVYRASAIAFSTRRNLAEDKAFIDAKKNLLEEITAEIKTHSGMSEDLIRHAVKKGISMKRIDIVCSDCKRMKGGHKCSIAIEMKKSGIKGIFKDKND